jgi:large subunit ribosomal protein L22
MEFTAKARYLSYSPYKLRPLVDVVRGKNARYAINWLRTYRSQRSEVVKKVLDSVLANAKNLKNIEPENLFIKEICVDQGPIHRYFKPGAQGRANPQRKRLCHMKIVLESKEA